jgi:adenine-specific DNA methylase
VIEEQKEEANGIFKVPDHVNYYRTDCTGIVNFDYEKSKKEHDKKMRTYLRKIQRYQALKPVTITYTQRLYVK